MGYYNRTRGIKIPGLEDQYIELENECWACKDGKRTPGLIAEDGSCSQCKGIGYYPTEEGELILEFVKRHLGN